MNFHKQKLYALILAGVGLISLLLPWLTFGGFTIRNGFSSWGILSLLGIGGVVLASFMGDKTKPYDETFKKLALASFGAIALGGLLTFFTKGSAGGRGMFAISANVGFGVWLAIFVGLAGLGWITGIIKLPPPNPPPPPPKP